MYYPYKGHGTGTSSQITADYGISSYFSDNEGINVNLFVLSRLKWKRSEPIIRIASRPKLKMRPFTALKDERSRLYHNVEV